jgi:CRP-like cAMP-binding protein
MHGRSEDVGALARKLDQVTPLSGDERAAIMALPVAVKDFGADEDVVREGDVPTECAILLEGFACRYKILASGRRQLLSFHLPGDIPDLQSLHLKIMDHGLATVLPSKVASIRHERIRELIARFPRIGDHFWRDTLIDAAVFREWIVVVGGRPAIGRTAHLLCELFYRFSNASLTIGGNSFRLSLTQQELGDALGLSLVQVNRSIQKLKREGLVRIRNGRVTIVDWRGLQRRAEFDPTYLHC